MSTATKTIEQLRRRYAADLPLKVTKATECVTASLAGPWNLVLSEMAYRLVHSLIGSSGTFGYHEFSRTARSAESILRASAAARALPSPREALELREIMARLNFMAVTLADDAIARVS